MYVVLVAVSLIEDEVGEPVLATQLERVDLHWVDLHYFQEHH